MRPSHPIAILIVLLVTALAGCISEGNTDPLPTTDDGNAPDPAPTEETGSVVGEVLTLSLEEVGGAAVAARSETGDIVQSATTDASGRFTMNGLEPGPYRIQVSALCCKANAKAVEVHANEVSEVSFQLEELSEDDLQAPRHVEEEWEGFISCGFGALAASWAACSTLEDPNDDFFREFTARPGLTELVVGVAWTPVGGVSGNELWVLVEDEGCGLDCPTDRTYADVSGGPDIVLRITEGPSSELAFEAITDERVMQMRVFPGGDANVLYQQPFKVYWHAFYWQYAPEGFTPFPDA